MNHGVCLSVGLSIGRVSWFVGKWIKISYNPEKIHIHAPIGALIFTITRV